MHWPSRANAIHLCADELHQSRACMCIMNDTPPAHAVAPFTVTCSVLHVADVITSAGTAVPAAKRSAASAALEWLLEQGVAVEAEAASQRDGKGEACCHDWQDGRPCPCW